MKRILIAMLLIANTTFAQETAQYEEFVTVDVELLSIGFTMTKSINKKMGIGLGCQFGAGLRYNVISPEYFYLENLKIKLFWRYHITPRTYLNAGVFWSKGKMVEGELSNQNKFAGIQIDIFTGLKNFKIGVKTQTGKSFLYYYDYGNYQFLMITFTPALQVYF